MIGLIRSLVLAVRLYLMRRSQPENVKLRRFFRESYDIDVGLYSYGCFDRWRMPGPLRVGRYCSFAGTVRAPGANHPMTGLTTHPALYSKAFGVVDHDMPTPTPLVIEDDVWVAHNVIILPGCKHIGRGAVIGAGAIVTRDVPPYTVMAGAPARKLRDRFAPELVEAIEASRWWELDLAGLRDLAVRNPEILFNPSVSALKDLADSRHG